MRVAAAPSSVGNGTRVTRCSWCGSIMKVGLAGKGSGRPAKQCSCGAVFCPDCYEKLPGLFGEELGAIVMVFTPVAAVGWYLAKYGMAGIDVLLVFGLSILGGIGLYLAVIAPMSRIVHLAKQCAICGGRTASDWRSLSIVEQHKTMQK